MKAPPAPGRGWDTPLWARSQLVSRMPGKVHLAEARLARGIAGGDDRQRHATIDGTALMLVCLRFLQQTLRIASAARTSISSERAEPRCRGCFPRMHGKSWIHARARGSGCTASGNRSRSSGASGAGSGTDSTGVSSVTQNAVRYREHLQDASHFPARFSIGQAPKCRGTCRRFGLSRWLLHV
jgi:hypothetical protein